MQCVSCVNNMIYALNSAETTTQIAYFKTLQTYITIWHSDLLLLRVFIYLFAYSWAFLRLVLLIPQFTTRVLILASIMIWKYPLYFQTKQHFVGQHDTVTWPDVKSAFRWLCWFPMKCLDFSRKFTDIFLNVSMVPTIIPTIVHWFVFVELLLHFESCHIIIMPNIHHYQYLVQLAGYSFPGKDLRKGFGKHLPFHFATLTTQLYC